MIKLHDLQSLFVSVVVGSSLEEYRLTINRKLVILILILFKNAYIKTRTTFIHAPNII